MGLFVLFLENLSKLFGLMDPNSPERVAFVSRALKWSSGGSGKLGHPRLHQLLALTLWKGRPATLRSQARDEDGVCSVGLSVNVSFIIRSPLD